MIFETEQRIHAQVGTAPLQFWVAVTTSLAEGFDFKP